MGLPALSQSIPFPASSGALTFERPLPGAAQSARLYQSIVETTANTPLLELRIPDLTANGRVRVLLKLEYFNPISSVKDRVGRALIEDAEAKGLLRPDTHIIEPTSGNTGIALAFVAAARGYHLTLTMPETMSVERRTLLRALGAKLVLTPAALGMRGAIDKAEELVARDRHAWSPRQFENPANPAAHERSTGPEIWRDASGAIDLFVAGVGTGGTITGVTRFLRTLRPDLEAFAVEPAESPVISGGKPGIHQIQGIGAGFVPRTLDRSLLNGVEKVNFEDASAWTRRLARESGILAGISTGANLAAVARLAARVENRGKTLVTVAASSGERYLSTGLFPKFEQEEPPSLLQAALGLAYHI